MKKLSPFLVLTLLITALYFYNWGISYAGLSAKTVNSMVAVEYVEPLPPEINPHPPTTEEDKKRVAFAESIFKSLLIDKKLAASDKPLVAWQNSDTTSFHLTSDCLNTESCLNKNDQLKNYIHSLNNTFGSVVEYKHAHVIPWSFERFKKSNASQKTVVSKPGVVRYVDKGLTHHMDQTESTRMEAPNLKPDEYMVHIYVKFSKSNRWHHVDVIMSEDGLGKFEFRSFFIIQIPSPSHKLPDGVVC